MQLLRNLGFDVSSHDQKVDADYEESLKIAQCPAPEQVPMNLRWFVGPTPRALQLAKHVRDKGFTTLQLHGLSNQAAVHHLVLALHANGLAGSYNFVFIPRSLHHDGLPGYAFINFTSSDMAALLVELWQDQLVDLACFAKKLKFKIAAKQGYFVHANESIPKYSRIRQSAVWPLVMTEDGSYALFANQQTLQALESWRHHEH
eukprot:5202808-Amphidinium_carterae.1